MSFWSSEKLRARQTRDKVIDPFEPKRIKHGAYDLSLGPEVFVSTKPEGTKQKLDTDEQITIPPGQFGLLLTEEVVAVPNNAIGFISIKFGIKMQGLVNVSGFHVDPGFKGRLKFAVYNAGSQNIPLSRGESTFIIWFSDLSETTGDGYNGEHNKQMGITSYDVRQLQGELASPAELKKQIDELKRENEQRFSVLDDKITTWRTITITLLCAIFIAVIVGIILPSLRISAERSDAPSNQPAQRRPSQEPTQELKQGEPAANQKTDSPASPPSNTQQLNQNQRND